MASKVRKAKRNPVLGVTTFYVPSSSTPSKHHMVLRYDLSRKRLPLYICQCNDSFGRRLPHLGSNTYSHCRHIQAVKEVSSLPLPRRVFREGISNRKDLPHVQEQRERNDQT